MSWKFIWRYSPKQRDVWDIRIDQGYQLMLAHKHFLICKSIDVFLRILYFHATNVDGKDNFPINRVNSFQ